MSVKSFFVKVGKEFEDLFGHASTWETTASATLKFVAPLVETIIPFVAPAAAPEVTAILNKVQAGLATASVLIADGQANPSLNGVLSAVTTNLAGIEAAAQIKDPVTQQKVTVIVNTIISEIQAITSSIPQPQPLPQPTNPPVKA